MVDIAERFLLKLITTQVKVSFLAVSSLHYKEKHGKYLLKSTNHYFSIRRIYMHIYSCIYIQLWHF